VAALRKIHRCCLGRRSLPSVPAFAPLAGTFFIWLYENEGNTDKRGPYDNFIHARKHHRRMQASR
jgi:hypothetical protein